MLDASKRAGECVMMTAAVHYCHARLPSPWHQVMPRGSLRQYMGTIVLAQPAPHVPPPGPDGACVRPVAGLAPTKRPAAAVNGDTITDAIQRVYSLSEDGSDTPGSCVMSPINGATNRCAAPPPPPRARARAPTRAPLHQSGCQACRAGGLTRCKSSDAGAGTRHMACSGWAALLSACWSCGMPACLCHSCCPCMPDHVPAGCMAAATGS
jgi:hypothetical protein